jgi:uncharacterized coiled-coil protein SlyX
MNEIELSKYIDRIAEAVVILTKRVQALEEQNASNSKKRDRKKPCKIIPMRIEKKT